MNKTQKKVALLAVGTALTVLLAGCAMAPTSQAVDEATAQVLKGSFREQGIARLDRLKLDASNQACSEAAGKPLDEKLAKAIEEANLKTVKFPLDGKFIGNWREGEKIAQNGRGLTWSDKPGEANGGSCYNCHQISKAELSFGSIGPSLYNYGKLRGVSDPAAAASKPIVEYTWGKLWNAKAYNACSGMPRFGHAAILGEQQIRDVMALLLDPQSPVNK
ncbi:sulfur oxidation c-type cytochrome SoxX [Polaromonas sp. JS666]|uniref:sulfur oxidation c-type cytochrome SoxX n=1 Tax=Polaromonas sp. (strain JS666 / ATCC BAA-500) TaxID=296591 RepID=UPI00004647EF|nr:sulfur oxidation c-type cytochrome SoxX [Polaromonas sp. JS666]ABE44542.1 monoheme cytochrome SoxX (sulfur oxidation) [Polaromonas sp. JS666]